MAQIRIWNPRPRKALTLEQVEQRQQKAVRFASGVLRNDDLASELESLSLEGYAARKGFEIENPTREGVTKMTADKANLADLADKLNELPDKIAERVAACLPPKADAPAATHEKNPVGSRPKDDPVRNSSATVTRRLDRLKDLREQRDAVLDSVGDALDALDEGDADTAEDILDEVLGQYEVEDQGNGDNRED